jgi:hypothetical protein
LRIAAGFRDGFCRELVIFLNGRLRDFGLRRGLRIAAGFWNGFGHGRYLWFGLLNGRFGGLGRLFGWRLRNNFRLLNRLRRGDRRLLFTNRGFGIIEGRARGFFFERRLRFEFRLQRGQRDRQR